LPAMRARLQVQIGDTQPTIPICDDLDLSADPGSGFKLPRG
jgi:hypothetical protein